MLFYIFYENMENSYFAQEHSMSQVKINKPKKSVSIPTFIISLIMVAALVIIVFLKRDDILWFFWEEQDIEETNVSKNLSVWDDVSFSWSIKNDGDMVNYTHSYLSSEYWVIWLKSSKLNLNNYSQNVYFEWIVEKISHEIPIVNVTVIYDLEDVQEDTWDLVETGENEEANDKYLPKLWLYFSNDFFEKYSLINEWDDSLIKIKNLETSIIYAINYFKCNSSNNSENCSSLNDFYSQSSSNKFVDKNWVIYYKDWEVNSWFFSSDEVFGYKVNDGDDWFARDLSTLITVVNEKFVEKNVSANISKLCTVWHNSMQAVKESKLVYKNNGFFYYVTWNDASENLIVCELEINPSLSSAAQVVSVEVISGEKWDADSWDEEKEWETSTWTDTQKWEDSEPEKQETYTRDPNVEQFPINLEKTLTFTSSRWHSFIFPSSKIAYQWRSSSENFWQVWVNCFSAMNVVKYEEKELVETQWNVVIYECTVKNTFDDSDDTLIYRQVWDKHFVIQINDPARVDFANNIEIQA